MVGLRLKDFESVIVLREHSFDALEVVRMFGLRRLDVFEMSFHRGEPPVHLFQVASNRVESLVHAFELGANRRKPAFKSLGEFLYCVVGRIEAFLDLLAERGELIVKELIEPSDFAVCHRQRIISRRKRDSSRRQFSNVRLEIGEAPV